MDVNKHKNKSEDAAKNTPQTKRWEEIWRERGRELDFFQMKFFYDISYATEA